MSSPKTSVEPAKTFAELKQSGYQSVSVKDELRANLIKKLKSGEKLFRGIVGYDETVIPQLVNAILARHNVILLGLRGQAKSRIIRGLTKLLDDRIPIVAGSEVNDDPFKPISAYGRQTLALHGDQTHIDWIDRDSRFVEKLATPDVTIADIIGDVDPIKAAKGGHLLSDELTIHYGLLPRANRGIFAINELPDLAGKIQVGLFNIMQEGDVQIKGYPVRLPLDVMLIFSANPEDYTARGKIITPLKDRIGTEIMTHYPAELQTAVEITRQEAWVNRGALGDTANKNLHDDSTGSSSRLHIPEFIRELVEQIAFEARDDDRVDKHSGVSQRMPITVIESVLSNAERRALLIGEDDIVPRISDVYAAVPSMTGKMELEYEGEQIGAHRIAKDLIKRAAGQIFEGYFVGIDFAPTVQWFDQGNNLRLADTASATECGTLLEAVPELIETSVIPFDFKQSDTPQLVAACEFVLEGLYAQNKISRNEEGGYTAVTKAKKDRRGMIYDDLTETGKYS
jgi:magnesium chelatase subunit I